MAKEKFGELFKKYIMALILVIVLVFFNIETSGKLLIAQNVNNLISQNAYVFVLAAGMLLCILTGGNIDLACGSVICFVGGIGGVMMDKGISGWLAVVVMLVGGLLVGLWQGFWIAYIKVPPFITTLAGMYAFRGLSNVVLQGMTYGVRDETFLKVFGGGANCYVPDPFHGENINILCMAAGIVIAIAYLVITIINAMNAKKKETTSESPVFAIIKAIIIDAIIIFLFYKLAMYKGIPSALIWIVIVLGGYGYVTNNTRIGRYLYAVGGNEKATKLSGIDPRKVYMFAYIHMGLMSGLAGILCIARAGIAEPTAGVGYEMDAIAACFIGGASAYGGEGGVFGIIIGALLMGVINMGMSLMSIDPNYQRVVKGIVLLVAIIFDVLSNKKKK